MGAAFVNTIMEIEAAIEKLQAPQLEELADWLEALRQKRAAHPSVEVWLRNARGAALPDVTTEQIMALTRGEE